MGINFESKKLNARSDAQSVATKNLKEDGVTTTQATYGATHTRISTYTVQDGTRTRSVTDKWVYDDEHGCDFYALERYLTADNGKTSRAGHTVYGKAPMPTNTGKIETTKVSAELLQAQQAAIQVKLPNAKKV